MKDWILIADDLRDLAALGAPFRMMTTRDYVLQPKLLAGSRPKIINLARNYNYQTDSYYASLLAEARGHRVIPTVETLLEMYAKDGPEEAIPDLEEVLNKDLQRSDKGTDKAQEKAPAAPEKMPERILVCFGETEDDRFKRFGRILFDWYRAPAIVVQTGVNGVPGVKIKRIKLAPFTTLKGDELKFFIDSLHKYTGRVWKSPKARVVAKHSIAVLYDPNEKMPPSSVETLKYWARFAEKDGIEVEPITKKDLGKLAEFDALFIRETTSITNHTYRFARRAWAEGMPVIDDPVSMMRCTNKVYLWERLSGAGLPSPQTIIVQERTPLEEVADTLKFPVVLKIPDGSFSRGVKKAEDMAQLKEIANAFLEDSDLVIAQKFIPTEFDWRIGVLDGRAIFVCQYKMARGHWQIVNHKTNGAFTEGGFRSLSIGEAPPDIIDIGVRAANLIGDGFYGVDIKSGPDGPVVIEINDNPNLEHGIEDGSEKSAVWTHLTDWFIKRLNA
jgi:glutathione synthase/RimK-type ligase-like ATP-grasp enzyme